MSRKILRLVGAALVAATMLSACRDTGRDGEGRLFEISGKLFVFNYRLARATYVVTLRPLQPMQEGQVAVASFQNPAGGEPLVVEQKVWPKLGKVSLESPALFCIVKDKPYAISISIKDADGTVLQKIDTTLMSTQDQSVLPDRPLVIDQLYTPNPELAGHPDGKLPGAPKPDCSKTG
ncbi:MAG: hypothetical protein E5Y88_12095 [Mesorhizobium sp.]|uniref:hypothetical protein n=1 Tax=unclassified Mesorhizobium TaxID=325217 RepID=UPI000FC9C8F2|nr:MULTISPECIES: hypothetical protein [unclassified Mesorhizobium]RUU38923.1 hypothetical protein EOD08_15145 [Mesorhizobium sp. M6A.T.Ca.TU.002.02.2.1]RUU30066.1 hypothetical protein EOC94_09075 [Mesorhizobium sp. M6A.T.Ce.TU.016.01.1.1]RWP78228.1 MAG: hypothetical protein EOR09_06725 [Mesorhizobium sp.]RWQ39080.1 MAG: hypothetical protein EOS20_06925 [Mesorhizobium sp.]RWQ67788.1 MAG: hypothetical protein EOS86_03150 [Mesorhizobium sp.]